jgi:hypothetical protein
MKCLKSANKFVFVYDKFLLIIKEYVQQCLSSAVTSGMLSAPTCPDILSATYFDVAVLRCLFCLHWAEDGIYWALRYTHQRLLEVCDEYRRGDCMERERSRSLPFPDINVLRRPSFSMPPSPTERNEPTDRLLDPGNKQAHSNSNSNSQTLPSSKLPTIPSDKEVTDALNIDGSAVSQDRPAKEPPSKKIRVMELRQFFDGGKAFMKKKDSSEEMDVQSPKIKTEHTQSSMFSRFFKDDSSSSCTVSSTLETDKDTMCPGGSTPLINQSEADDGKHGGVHWSKHSSKHAAAINLQSDHDSTCSSQNSSRCVCVCVGGGGGWVCVCVFVCVCVCGCVCVFCV